MAKAIKKRFRNGQQWHEMDGKQRLSNALYFQSVISPELIKIETIMNIQIVGNFMENRKVAKQNFRKIDSFRDKFEKRKKLRFSFFCF